MNKEKFIWFVIRSIGIFLLVKNFGLIFKALCQLTVMLLILPSMSELSAKLSALAIALSLTESVVGISIFLYLIFFGRLIYKIVNHNSKLAPHSVLEYENYIEIIIRFIGTWLVFKTIVIAIRPLEMIIDNLLIRHFLADAPEGGEVDKLVSMLNDVSLSLLADNVISVVIFIVMAWYFLKKGNFFIRLLSRFCLGKNNETYTVQLNN